MAPCNRNRSRPQVAAWVRHIFGATICAACDRSLKVADAIAEIYPVKGLLQGLEAEFHLVLDVMLPASRVVDALKASRAEFPTVSLRLYVEALGAVTQMVLNRTATIGIGGPLDAEIASVERIGVGSVELVPVAAPDHPLALAGRNAPGAARDHIQLVLTDRSPLTQGQGLAVVGTQTWRLADLGSKHMLLKEGIGWGNMPEPMVREDLAAGRLTQLDLPDCKGGLYRLQALYRTDAPPGPAGSWLIDRFQAQATAATEAAAQRPIRSVLRARKNRKENDGTASRSQAKAGAVISNEPRRISGVVRRG